MYADVEIDDFNMTWEELIAKHGLHNNVWASQIFDCRKGHAASIYTRVVFKEFREILLEAAKLRIISSQQTSSHVIYKIGKHYTPNKK
ncbi:hypothetical protein Lal_00008299 [Lupinus albus]|nr:hypothetical protein Lal_00008299 [Lupinus albus]